MNDYHPKEWHDAATAAVMLRDFRPKETNPEGWSFKMNLWIRSVERWSQATGTVEFSMSDIQRAFVRDSVLPSDNCVKLVVSNMLRNNQLATLDQFVDKCKSARHAGWLSWGLSAATRPLSWALGALTAAPDEEEVHDLVTGDTRFVNVLLIEQLADKLLRDVERAGQYMLRNDVLLKRAAALGLSSRALELALLQLEARKQAFVTVDHGIRVVKFGDHALTELELALSRLEAAKELVDGDVKKAEAELDALRNEARECVREKNKLRATQLLRRKKRLEAQLARKETQLDNIDVLVQQLSEADSREMILRAFAEGAEMLKAAQRHRDLDATLADVEEAVSEQTEMLAALAAPLKPQPDEDELKDELAALLAEDELEPKPAKPTTLIPAEKQDRELEDLMARLQQLRAPDHEPDAGKQRRTEREVQPAS